MAPHRRTSQPDRTVYIINMQLLLSAAHCNRRQFVVLTGYTRDSASQITNWRHDMHKHCGGDITWEGLERVLRKDITTYVRLLRWRLHTIARFPSVTSHVTSLASHHCGSTNCTKFLESVNSITFGWSNNAVTNSARFYRLASQLPLFINQRNPRHTFRSSVSVCRLTQHVNLSKTHYIGDMFRLPSSHHQAYVNIRTITLFHLQTNAVISDRSNVYVRLIMATRLPKHVASVVCFWQYINVLC
jgi:hypothetical protein